MDMATLLGVLLAVSIALERLIVFIQPFYLQIKAVILGKTYTECTAAEKRNMAILLGPVLCILAQIGIDLPQINEAAIIQYMLAGLVASLGSGTLHAIYSIVVAIQKNAENLKNGTIDESQIEKPG
jgi:cobalamin biosynthesis protein CobD/CbiB